MYQEWLGYKASLLIKGGVLISGVVYTLLYVAGTMHSVLIKGGILISVIVLLLIHVSDVFIGQTLKENHKEHAVD